MEPGDLFLTSSGVTHRCLLCQGRLCGIGQQLHNIEIETDGNTKVERLGILADNYCDHNEIQRDTGAASCGQNGALAKCPTCAH